MSCYNIYYRDGAKYCRPITSEEQYRAFRNSGQQRTLLNAARKGDKEAKKKLVQMNYSCIPGEDMKLKGCTTASNSVGMDVDLDSPPALPKREGENTNCDFEKQMLDVKDKILAKQEELGLLMLERSATKGYHLVFRRHPEMSQVENLKWASELIGVPFDEGAKDVTRVFYTTTADEGELLFLSQELFRLSPAPPLIGRGVDTAADTNNTGAKIEPNVVTAPSLEGRVGESLLDAPSYLGIPYSAILSKWWELYYNGKEPVTSNRDSLTYELALNIRNICGQDRQLMDRVIPCYDGFPEAQKMKCIDSALSQKIAPLSIRLRNVLDSLRCQYSKDKEQMEALDEEYEQDDQIYYKAFQKMPMGVKDSIEAVDPALCMPVLATITPVIGALATGVKLDVHGKARHLNLFSYIVGEFASGKGAMDDIYDAWTSELREMDNRYIAQHDEWKRQMRKKRNAKDQPEEPILPIRLITLNNTSANVAEQVSRTGGKHALSFTPEADILAMKWKQSVNDYSIMLRMAYDGSRYDREAKSVDAVSVHIPELLWNVVMCGTPDALYRVISNYTDGFQSRVILAHTPDNTFAPLPEHPHEMTERQREHIQQVAHLLPLMEGTLTLPKVEQQGRDWLEDIRKATIQNFDKIKAKQRMRVCVTAQRMVACLILCKVCQVLLDKYGMAGAERELKADPKLWIKIAQRCQSDVMLQAFDDIANSLIDNNVFYFRDRISAAISSRNYAANGNERSRNGKNDNIYSQLPQRFTFEQALNEAIAVRGVEANHNMVHQMLKNWKKQGLIAQEPMGMYRKLM